MKKTRNKTAIIVALMLAITGLAIGFAAFSRNITISSNAEVTPNSEDFNVQISSKSTELSMNPIDAVLTGKGTFTADSAQIGADGLSITDLKVYFNEPGQTAKYTFYLQNTGKYQAYRNDITFANISGKNVRKNCIAGSGANADLVAQACEGMNVTVTYNNGNITDSLTAGEYNGCDKTGIDVDKYDTITVEVTYDGKATRADGPFTVEFGDIVFNYGSVPTCSSGGTAEPA